MTAFFLVVDESSGKIQSSYTLTVSENAQRISVPSGCSLVEAARQPQGTENHYIDGEFSYLAPTPPPPPEPPPAPAAPTLDELKVTKAAAVMTKRDAVINGGITFNTVRFQTRPDDRENVAGAAQLAFMAIVAGAVAGNLRWHGGATDFGWIAEDNSVVTMDAQTVVLFAKATAAFKSACIFYARTLKDSTDAAADHTALDAIDITTGWPV